MENQIIGPAGPNPVAEEQFRKGFELARENNIDDAILAVEAAIAVSPDESRYHDLLGTLYARKGLYIMALSEWKRSIETDPDHAEVFRRIEMAEKMKGQMGTPAQKYFPLGLGLVAGLLIMVVMWGVWNARAYRNAQQELVRLSTLEASLATDYKPITEFQALETEKANLQTQLQQLTQESTAIRNELNAIKTGGQYVSIEEHQKLRNELQVAQELRNRVSSELGAARERVTQLETQLASVSSATGTGGATGTLAAKDSEIKRLNESYQKIFNDSKQMEKERDQARQEVVRLNSHVADLEKQMAQAMAGVPVVSASPTGSGTGTAVAGVPREEVLFLMNQTLAAVGFLAEGNRDKARETLKLVQSKSPAGVAVAPVLDKITSKQETVAEATPKPTEKPAKPTEEEPTRKPTRKPAPKPTPKPTEKPEKVVSKTEKKSEVAVPKPVEGKSKATPKPTPAPTRDKEAEARRLYETKKRLADQGLANLRAGRLEDAERAIDEAYRIDPKDPRINQLRDALQRAQRSR